MSSGVGTEAARGNESGLGSGFVTVPGQLVLRSRQVFFFSPFSTPSIFNVVMIIASLIIISLDISLVKCEDLNIERKYSRSKGYEFLEINCLVFLDSWHGDIFLKIVMLGIFKNYV